MKKTFILLALVVFISTTGFVNSPGSATSQVAIKTQTTFGGVPEAVEVSFHDVVTDVMNNWYPNNAGCDCSAITWTRDKNAWVATGDVTLIGGSGGINIVTSNFKQTGEFVSLNYVVLP